MPTPFQTLLWVSVPASIGFIELFGLAVGNGIVLVSYINQLRNEGTQMDEAIKSDRMKPSEAMRLLDEYERGLKAYTYLSF